MKTSVYMKTVATWAVRIIGLLLILYGLLLESFYYSFSNGFGNEYPVSRYFYPLIYLFIGICLIILSRSIISWLWRTEK